VSEPGDGAARAAVYFRARNLERVLEAVRRVYWRNGRAAGMAVVDDASLEEHQGLAALSGRAPRRGPLRLDLADLEETLLASGFQCSLADLLLAFDGKPPATRADERARAQRDAEDRRAACYRLLESIAEDLPPGSLGRSWLETAHVSSWLVERYRALSPSELVERSHVVRVVVRALSALPVNEPRRLAVFANQVAGDPHAFDPDREAGRLLTRALRDLFGAELGLAAAAGDPLSTADQQDLYERAGLLRETISSTVAVANLRAAIRRDGTLDPSVAENRTPSILSLRNLIDWREAHASAPDIFIVENPVVFEDLLDGVSQHQGSTPGPTLICTAGWLSHASWRLLDLLLVPGDVRQIFYSGDFDPSGLQIAERLRRRYPGHFHPWRYSVDDYHQALRASGAPAKPTDLRRLATLPPEFATLAQAMQDAGRWAYQEAIVDLLLSDVLDACPE
jgi:uncharacterized protein (TIGR02679 family)